MFITIERYQLLREWVGLSKECNCEAHISKLNRMGLWAYRHTRRRGAAAMATRQRETIVKKIAVSPEILLELSRTQAIKALCVHLYARSAMPLALRAELERTLPANVDPTDWRSTVAPPLRKIWKHLSLDVKLALYVAQLEEGVDVPRFGAAKEAAGGPAA